MMKSEENAPEKKAFKDWFDDEAARRLADQVSSVSPEFRRSVFLRRAREDLSSLEFHARVRQFSDALAAALPESVPEALRILVASLPPAQVDCESVTDGWLQWPVGQFIADHGTPHLEESLEAMIELTQRFSSEFAVRPFLEQYPEEVFARLLDLTSHENPHVRRWCSEGTRTRLPWGRKLHFLIERPDPIFPILERLKDDPELYVRRSVANNLNDLSKDHPDLVLDRCREWIPDPAAERDTPRGWIVRHGLRSLIKEGRAEALDRIGYGRPRSIEADLSIEPGAVSIGDSVELKLELNNRSRRRQSLLVDYVVHYPRKNGQANGKVFKWKTLDLAGSETLLLSKRHSMRETTIRALYPGTHRVEVQVNGVRLGDSSFELR